MVMTTGQKPKCLNAKSNPDKDRASSESSDSPVRTKRKRSKRDDALMSVVNILAARGRRYEERWAGDGRAWVEAVPEGGI